tara:strand:+ start:35 stop:745 length:711 start_codon:yes stop_codon:yes gene_type:complete
VNKFIAKGIIEFLAVLLGISASFWLNELSIDNQNERERKKVLKSLQMEINEIKIYCDERKRTWEKDIDLLNVFLYDSNQVFDINSILKMTTSKIRIETFMVLYRVFDPPMNRYYSIINAGDLKYIISDRVKEKLSRLHNTSFSYVETAVEHEKQLKQSFIPFLTDNHPKVILARGDNKTTINAYAKILNDALQSDRRLKAKFIMLKRYLESKLSILEMYNVNLEDLESEINSSLSR